jgi:hypothetical protein
VRIVAVWLVVAACGGAPPAAVPWHGTRWVGPDPLAWPEPSCFAYSPARRAYACLGWAADNERPADIARRGGIDLVGAGSRERHLLWNGTVARRVEAPAAVHRRMRSLGFREVRARRVELSGGGWHRVGRYSYRYELHLHEGDASFEYSARLWLRCPDRREVAVALDDAVLEQGERAVLFAAPGAREVALGVQGADGGEGVEYRSLDTVVLEPASACARRRAAR